MSEQELIDAVAKSNTPLIKELLKSSASATKVIGVHGFCALDKAIEQQNEDVVELLLAHAIRHSAADQTTLASLLTQKLLQGRRTIAPVGEAPGPVPEEKADQKGDEFWRVERALRQVKAGGFVLVSDNEDRENEGDLIIAAEKVTAEQMAFMVNYTSGIICVGLPGERLDQLELPQMVTHNTEAHSTAFTHSVDYKVGTSTGISAADRAATIRALTDDHVKPSEFSRPGHVFPLRARPGGVLERQGHTEASVDLARLAGLTPAGAMCEVTNRDGSMARAPQLDVFAKQHGIPQVTIAELVAYRKAKGV